jgi:hypothetical protein
MSREEREEREAAKRAAWRDAARAAAAAGVGTVRDQYGRVLAHVLRPMLPLEDA